MVRKGGVDMNRIFEQVKSLLDREFTEPNWIAEGAMTEEQLKQAVDKLEASISSKALCKAKTFALIAEHAPIGIDTADIFQDKLYGFGIMIAQRAAWETRIKEDYLQKESADMRLMWKHTQRGSN